MADLIMGYGVSGCFGTRLAPTRRWRKGPLRVCVIGLHSYEYLKVGRTRAE